MKLTIVIEGVGVETVVMAKYPSMIVLKNHIKHTIKGSDVPYGVCRKVIVRDDTNKESVCHIVVGEKQKIIDLY